MASPTISCRVRHRRFSSQATCGEDAMHSNEQPEFRSNSEETTIVENVVAVRVKEGQDQHINYIHWNREAADVAPLLWRNSLYEVVNTDCTCWFIHPRVAQTLRSSVLVVHPKGTSYKKTPATRRAFHPTLRMRSHTIPLLRARHMGIRTVHRACLRFLKSRGNNGKR